MDAIIGLFTGGGSGILAAVGAIILALAGAFFQGRRSGKAQERAKAAERANKGWVDASEVIGEANEARLNQRRSDDADGGLMRDDGFKRKPPE